MKKYYTYTIKKLITVQHLVTIEYLDLGENFIYPAESHPFFEFIFVEKGAITCKTHKKEVSLNKHDFFLIQPNSSHSYHIKSSDSATILIVCFKSKSNALSFIKGAKSLYGDTREILNKILAEAKATFVFPFDKKLTLNAKPRLGSQQLIKNYIEEILIKLVQMIIYNNRDIKIATNASEAKKAITKEIVNILEKNIYSKITLSDICNQTFYSKTYLNEIFKEIKGVTIMQYYQNLKIDESKILLKSKESITAISEKLCFETPQYFSKAFKSKVKMTPTEYRKNVTKNL